MQMWAQLTATPQQPEGRPLPSNEELSEVAVINQPLPLTPDGAQLSNLHVLGMLAASVPPSPEGNEISRNISRKDLTLFQIGYGSVAGRGMRWENYFDVQEEVVYEAVIVGRMVLEVRKSRHNAFTILPLVCYMDETAVGNIPYGSAMLLKPRQQWANQFENALLDMVARMPKAQVAIDSEAADMEPRELAEAEESLTRGDRLVRIKNPKESLFNLPAGTIPPAIEGLAARQRGSIPGALGMSGYNIGNVGDLARTAFRLVEQQTENAMKTTSESFDHFSLFLKAQTTVLAKCIRSGAGRPRSWCTSHQSPVPGVYRS